MSRMDCPNCWGMNPSCPVCGTPFSGIRIDRPHAPWGQHVDVITPLGSEIPGIQKLRIDGTGKIIDDDILIKKNWP